ncbi:MAG: hypothetical protein POELPBGB_03184 [Bacteroidia bacterium]|nr:hypothetical protein [Bacteroidia bacterium]
MISEDQQEKINKLSKYLDKAELLLAAIITVALVFKIQHWPGAGILLSISLTTLSVMYFFNAFVQDKNSKLQRPDVFFTKLIYWGLSVGAQGLLFVIQHWPNGNFMLTICCISSVAGALYILKVRRERQDMVVFSDRLLLRVVVFSFICIAAVIKMM